MGATQIHRSEVTGSRPPAALRSRKMALIDRDEAAKLLEVHPRTLERYIADEDLKFPKPAKRVGRVRLWNQGEVTRWGKKMLPLPTGRPLNK
jgi:excisionase family DNA binding protein